MKPSGYNRLALEVYDGATRVYDLADDLPHVAGLTFETFFPGGVFGSCSFWVPRDPLRMWLFRQGMRLVVRNGLAVVYEGGILAQGYSSGGRHIEAAGYWGVPLLGSRWLNKPWCDMRYDEATWVKYDQSTGYDRVDVDRGKGGIELRPKIEAFTSGEGQRVRYTAPTGQTVKRVTYDYELQEGAQNWSIDLFNVQDDAIESGTSITASGTGSIDVTLGTPSQSVDLRLVAGANQTPTAPSGTIFGHFTNIKVYTETGSINPTEIVKDWIGAISALNSDTTKVDSNTLTMEPWVTDGYELAASNLARLAAFGDSSYNSWAAQVIESERAATPDGKPVLKFSQWPSWTDYEYAVRWDEENIAGELQINKSQVWNYVVVTYTDALGRRRVVTPADDANLTDSASVARYGQREYVLSAGQVSSTMAVAMGRRWLANSKDEHFYVAGPLTVVGAVRNKHGGYTPVSHIRAGQRVKIENFLTDEVGQIGQGLIQHITHTAYTDMGEQIALSFGVPDLFGVLVAQLALGANAGGSLPGF